MPSKKIVKKATQRTANDIVKESMARIDRKRNEVKRSTDPGLKEALKLVKHIRTEVRSFIGHLDMTAFDLCDDCECENNPLFNLLLDIDSLEDAIPTVNKPSLR